MRTLEEVKGRCRIDDDGCWIWTGATAKGAPRIYAPRHDGKMVTHCGRRAVWQMQNPGVRMPDTLQAFGTCGKGLCVNPECGKVGPKKLQGAVTAHKGWLKGKIRTAVAARTHGRARSVLTPELIAEIQASPESGVAIARRLRISHQTVSKARRGKVVCFQPVGGMFSQLLGARP